MLHKLRLLHIDIGQGRSDYAVASHFHSLHRIRYLLILLLFLGQLPHKRDQFIFIIHRNARHPADVFIIIFIIYIHAKYSDTIRKPQSFLSDLLHIFIRFRKNQLLKIANICDLIQKFPCMGEELLFDGMIDLQHIHPFGQIKFQLADRKFIQDLL